MRLLQSLLLVTVTAQLVVSIFPEKFDLELSRGEIFQDIIRVANLSRHPLPIKIKVMNFSPAGEKGEIIFEESNEAISFNPSKWIKFKEDNFILNPNQSKQIEFSIKVPENAEPGGYYAVALFQTESFLEEKFTKIIPHLGALFLLKIKDGQEKYPPLEKQFELIELNAPFFLESTSPLILNFRLKNNDPVHIRVGGKLIIYNFLGKIKKEIEIKEQTVLPQKIRFFEIKIKDKGWRDKFLFGPYRAELILSSLTWREKIGNERQLVKSFNFFVFPLKIFLILLLIIFLIIFIRLIKKKKNEKLLNKNT